MKTNQPKIRKELQTSYYYLLLFVILGTACNTTRLVPEDELLYTGTEVVLRNPEGIRNVAKLERELSYVTKPVAANKFQLWWYSMFGPVKEGEKGLKKFARNLLGVEPTLLDVAEVEKSKMRMEERMRDIGFFGSNVEWDTLTDGRTVSATYYVNSYGQYKIQDVDFPPDTGALRQIIDTYNDISYVKEGDFYNKANLDAERVRIEKLLNNRGYPDFDKNYIYYFVDTTENVPLTTDVFVRVEPPLDDPRHERFLVGNTTIYSTYSLDADPNDAALDSVQVNDELQVVRRRRVLKDRTLERMLVQGQGDVYNEELQRATINHYLDLGVFKYVNMRYERDTTGPVNYLHRKIYMTPGPSQTVGADVELNNRVGGFLGTAAGVTYTHNNLFHGGERFDLRLSGGVETQSGDTTSFINTQDLTLSATLSVPQLWVPFRPAKNVSLFTPRTLISLQNEYQRRTNFYTINTTKLSFGYTLRPDELKTYRIFPISLNRVDQLNISQTFAETLSENPRLASSFADQFIAGNELIFVYNEPFTRTDNSRNFLRAEMELAGNLVSLLGQAPESGIEGDPEEIFGLPYAQYARFSFDARHYIKLIGLDNMLVLRVAPGVGVPYGNSEVLPYIKQFFVGGANSLRAFRLRSIGPGSYDNQLESDAGVSNLVFLDQTGDIKLELNAEYRFPLVEMLKGALFVDAGNVWTLQADERPEGQFDFADALNELAIGAGFGLRIDVEFMVIRLDFATPLRQVVPNEGFQWTLWQGDKISDNLVTNIAIGYPF